MHDVVVVIWSKARLSWGVTPDIKKCPMKSVVHGARQHSKGPEKAHVKNSHPTLSDLLFPHIGACAAHLSPLYSSQGMDIPWSLYGKCQCRYQRWIRQLVLLIFWGDATFWEINSVGSCAQFMGFLKPIQDPSFSMVEERKEGSKSQVGGICVGQHKRAGKDGSYSAPGGLPVREGKMGQREDHGGARGGQLPEAWLAGLESPVLKDQLPMKIKGDARPRTTPLTGSGVVVGSATDGHGSVTEPKSSTCVSKPILLSCGNAPTRPC